MIYNVCKPLLNIKYSFSTWHSKQLVLLDQHMLYCHLHKICSFMCDFKHILHVFCNTTLRYLEKLIQIQ